MSFETIIDEKGRICIPSELRKKFDLKPGEKMVFQVEENKMVIRKAVKPEEFNDQAEILESLIKSATTKPIDFKKLFE